MQIVTDGIIPEIPEAVDVENSPAELGIAVDVGTTTIAVSVWAMGKRKHLSTVAEKNNQMRYGYDVIRRISFATRPPLTGSSNTVETGTSALHYCIISQLEKMFTKAVSNAAQKLPRGFSPVVKQIVITGNTSMLSFVCGVPVNNMAAAPFAPETLFDFTATWESVRYGTCCPECTILDKPTAEMMQVFGSSIISPETEVYFPPCIGAFIGADTICAMITAGFPVPEDEAKNSDLKPWESKVKAPLLLADIGTNSELCLYIPETENTKCKILCTSAASGPAFEAANISCGMSSIEGAIDSVTMLNGKINLHTIGDAKPKGICGSGLVSLAAALFKNKYIDKNGVLLREKSKLGDGTDCIELTPAVYISQQDIRNLQLAKSAVKTGLQYLLGHSPETPVFCIAGGFGSKLNLHEAREIGLLPAELDKRTIQLGNASLSGASALLFSKSLRAKAKKLAGNSIQVNLAAVPNFQDNFLKSIDF
ncbi:MAG: DUF4445 domain-containing protein [Treponema sp.]|nr:DUF4445 domain-containing protein [Candidatus Treponema equifaecale]